MKSRIALALENEEFRLPDGRCLVIGPRGDADLSLLADPLCVQAFRPDYDRLKARGHKVATSPEGCFNMAVVFSVKSKAGSLSYIYQALTHIPPGALMLIDGQKEEGIESVIKLLKRLWPLEGIYSKSHGKLAWFRRPAELPEEVVNWNVSATRSEDGYVTLPGGFSASGADRGSELLVALVPQLKGRVADWGAGWGYLAHEILAEQADIAQLDLIEADRAMIDVAAMNVNDPRATFHWDDVNTFSADEPYDAIVSNPPFHTGRRADPELGRAFIRSAARNLRANGRFYMVANRHLPYEGVLKEVFRSGRLLAELEGFKLYEASRPKR